MEENMENNRIEVGVLGATGMVGQRYIKLLENHPWFRVTYVAASPRSAGKPYREAVANRWLIGADIPSDVADLTVQDANDEKAALGKCKFVFSALEMDKEAIKALEAAYAAEGIPVVSNASANRWTDDVPMLVPEINYSHLDIIKKQQEAHGWKKGFIVVKPNCSLQT
jgi:aspartate-semialdehyde dehydrogenase